MSRLRYEVVHELEESELAGLEAILVHEVGGQVGAEERPLVVLRQAREDGLESAGDELLQLDRDGFSQHTVAEAVGRVERAL